MSSLIHQILLKKLNETREDLLTIDIWWYRQMRSYTGVTVQFKLKAAQCSAGLQTIVTRTSKK